jgi:Fur family peroxide stress response transcriptional regulator
MGSSSGAIDARERQFAAALKADGLRMTHQRLEVIRELASATHHPGADELYRAVRERVPTISLDTVYRTLGTLAARGLIERIATPGAARFDPDPSMHHHFVCTRCGRIADLDVDDIGRIEVPPEVSSLGTVTSVRLEMKGVCIACAAAGDRSRESGLNR